MTAHQQATAHEHEHGDGHSHRHEHGVADHEHGPLESITHVHGGASALDIGGDIGALVALVDESAVDTELFVRSQDDPAVSVHTGVWWRDLGADRVPAALFCELVAGTYWVLDANGADVCSVEITGGVLSELDLRTSPPASER